MLRIALGTFRSRRGGALGSLFGVGLAAALVVSAGIVLESTLRVGVPVDRLAAAAIVVQRGQTFDGPGGTLDLALREQTRLDGRLAGRLAAIPGVRSAIADTSFATDVAAADGRHLTAESELTPAHGWASSALAPLALSAGHAPRSATDVVLDAGLARAWSAAPGERLQVAGAFGSGRFTVTGVAAPAPGRGASRSPAVYFRDDVATELSGTGPRVGLIGLVLAPGANEAAVTVRARELVRPLGLRIVTGSKRGEAESLEGLLGRADLLGGISLLAAFAAFVGVFVVSSAFALSVQQRHRELALLRAIGGTPRQVRRMVAVEALAVAVVGAVVATPLAVLVAVGERWALVHARVLPSDFQLVVSWMPFAVGLFAAVLTTQLAAFASGRRASRIRPADALRESSVEPGLLSRKRALAGVGALAVGVAVFVGTARSASGDDAPAAGLVWMLAAVMLGPVLALPFVWLIGGLLERIGGGPGLLARANAHANLRRLTSVATPLMLAVSLACALLVSRAVVASATGEQVADSLRADHVLVPAAGGLIPDVAAAAGRLPGVTRVAATFETDVVIPTDDTDAIEVPARAVDPGSLGGLIDVGVTAGSLADLHGPALAVDARRAGKLGWSVGDRVELWLGDGTPTRLRVVALFRRPLGFGEVIVPRSVVAAHVSDPLDDAVFVRSDSRAVAGLSMLAHEHPEMKVLTRQQFLRRIDERLRQEAIAVYVLLGVVVLFSAIAAINALSMSISERARELELLRLIGATRRQLRRMIRFEVALIAAFATVVGALTAAPGLLAFSYSETGSIVPAVPASIYVGLPAATALLALAASIPPTRRALRAGRGSVTAGVE
jgi:putative ABC transport system permease protein